MEVAIRNIGTVTVVTVTGEINAKTAPLVQDQVVPSTKITRKLLLDLSQVPLVSSAGLRLLLLLYRQMMSNNGKIALVGASDEVQDALSAAGFMEHFLTFDSVDAGLAALNQ